MLLETKVAGYTLIILFSPKISNMDIYIYTYISYIRKIYKYRIHYRTWLHNFICIYIYKEIHIQSHTYYAYLFADNSFRFFISFRSSLTSCRAQEQMIHEIQLGMLQIFHNPSSFRFFPFVSTSPVMGSKMVCAIIDLCQKDMANYGNSTIVYWDLWWYCRFLGNYWKTIGTSIFGFCNWIQWPLRSLDSAKPQKS